jgi:hypothetical protein
MLAVQDGGRNRDREAVNLRGLRRPRDRVGHWPIYVGQPTSIDRMHSAELIAALVRDPESEWLDLWGKPLDQRRVGKGTQAVRGRVGEHSHSRRHPQGVRGRRRTRTRAGVAAVSVFR